MRKITKSIVPTLLLCLMISINMVAQEEESSFKKNAAFDIDKIEATAAEQMMMPSLSCGWKETNIVIRWESNSAEIEGFMIQHSTDGTTYSSIGSIPYRTSGKYQYEAFSYSAGNNFFKLMQINKDGLVFETKAINVMCGMDGVHVFDMKETRISETSQITMQVKNEQEVVLELFDTHGNKVKTYYEGKMNANEIIFRAIDAMSLAEGKYYLSMRGEIFKESKVIEIVK